MNEVMLFNGTSSKIDCGSYDGLVGDKTISVWFKYKKSRGTEYPILLDNGKLQLYNTANYVFFTSDRSTTLSRNDVFSYVQYNHLVLTRTSTGVTNWYINGVLNGTANQSSGTPVIGTTNLIIGATAAGTYAHNNTLGNVRIYDGLLTPQEISALYSNEKKLYGL